MTENETVGWHHRVDGHEFEQAPGDGEEQGSLACCSPWDHKAGHNWATEQILVCVLSCFSCVRLFVTL